MNSRSTMLLLLLLLGSLVGCSDRSSRSTAQAATASDGQRPSREKQIEIALSHAAGYLASRQSADGAWRSEVYGPFKEGDALTPLVLATLGELSSGQPTARRPVEIAKATEYLAAMVGEDGTVRPPRYGLAYPVYAAAGAVICLSRQADDELRPARDAWLHYLRERQLTESLGWLSDDARYGGWGYSPEPPRKPDAGQPLGNLSEPNLSATVFALEALRAAGVDASDPAVQKALRFVKHCQNFTGDPATLDEQFDDGGFFFVQDDPVRNKAGVAGTDGAGRTRFVSYGSATADGLRAFELCEVPANDPGAQAAWRWLEKHFVADAHPGAYPADREGARPAVFFYYCHSLAVALAEAGSDNPFAAENKSAWATAIAEALLARRNRDGSWQNAAVDVREDDPLVATSLAASALARCRAIIGD